MRVNRFFKCLSLLLSFCMIFGSAVFAVPTLDPVETPDEKAVVPSSSETSELMLEKGIKPGLNMLNQTTEPWTFEGEMESFSSILSATDAGATKDNPAPDSINSSSKVVSMASSSEGYPSVAFYLPAVVEGERPVYSAFKYLKTYIPAADETIKSEGALWIMKNGPTYIAQSVGDFNPDTGWKEFAGLVDYSKAKHAVNSGDINTGSITSISIQAKSLANPGQTVISFDDITFIPSYKITYMQNDGTDTVVDYEYFLFEDEECTNLLTAYSPDLSVEPSDRYGYIFKGWSQNPESTVADAPETIELQNQDIVLYAVWERDESLPEATTYKWDFETAATRVWQTANKGYSLTYENGVAVIDTMAEEYSGTPYLKHPNVSLDTAAHRYLVVKAKNPGTISSITFYFTTSDNPSASEDQTVTIPLTTGDNTFREYYYDMSTHPLWTGNYQSCMLKLNGGTAGASTIEIEEIYFTTIYEPQPDEPAAEVEPKYIYSSGEISRFGNTVVTANDDGSLTIVRDTEMEGLDPEKKNQGAVYLAEPKTNGKAEDYPYLVVKAKDAENITGIKAYFSTGEQKPTPEFAEGFTTVGGLFSEDSDGFSYYVLDFSGSPAYSGNIYRFMIQLQTSGTRGELTAYEIYLAKDIEDIPAAEYHYPLTLLSAWGHHTLTDNGDGSFTVSRVSNGQTQGALNIAKPTENLAATLYNKFVIKADHSGDLSGSRLYYSSSDDTGYTDAGNKEKTVTFELLPDTGDGYAYYVADMSEKTDFTGNVNTFMISVSALLSATVYDVYLTNRVPQLEQQPGPGVVEKFALYASQDTITQEGATVTLTPYIRYEDGSEDSPAEVRYITDSVNAVLTRNDDGTATLTGKINGEITVTAVSEKIGATASVTVSVSGQSEKIAANSYKILTYGNSIMNHAPAPDIGWNGSWGMAASSADKDYVHRLIYYMEHKFGEESITHEYGGAVATFERAVPASDETADLSGHISGLVATAAAEQPDIITVQIGENVNTSPTVASYENAMRQFVTALKEAAPDALIVVCTPFWGGDNLIAGMTNVAEEFDLPLALVHTLNTDENKAIGQFEHSGVAAHPGDTGMDNIAKLLYEQINFVLSENDRTVYTTLPSSVEFVDPITELTIPNESAQLTARILPADAAQDIVWSTDNKDIATISETGLLTAKNNGAVTITATSKYDSSVTARITITVSGQTEPHTVTYDKNTTDEVTGMPEPNTLAKENFVFDPVYPVRETYKFLGWSLTPTGEVVSSVDVTEDITVYAQWELATSWYFDTDGYKENFTILNGFNQYVLDGVFMSIATGTDVETGSNVLKVVSPALAVNPSDYCALLLKIQNTEFADDTKLDLTIKTTDGDFNFSNPVTTSEYTTYIFNLSGVTGTITGFEFTPTNVDCTINIDEIAFVNEPTLGYDPNTDSTVSGMPVGEYNKPLGIIEISGQVPERTGYTFLGWSLSPDSKLLLGDTVTITEPTVLYAVWDKNDHWEFDSAADYSLSWTKSYSVTDGVLTIVAEHESGSPDVRIEKKDPNFAFPAESTSGVMELKIKYDFPSKQAPDVYFTTTSATQFSEGNKGSGTYPDTTSNGEFITTQITFPSHFKDTITRLAFDPYQSNATVEIDYLRFTDSEANIVTDNGETRKVSSDWATYIVKEGGTIAPQGKTELDSLRLSGDIDMSGGYITVTDVVEIADGADYAVFTLDMADAGVTSEDHMYIAGYDGTVELQDGAKYIVKLYNGIGFVSFADSTDVTKTTVYKVTSTGAQKENTHYITSDNSYSIRTESPAGVRFRASVSNRIVSATVENDGFTVSEYGFLVSTEKQMPNPAEALTLSAIDAGLAVKGVAFDENTNTIFEITEESIIISAVLVNVPDTAAAYTTNIHVRPYMILDNGAVIYGNAVTSTIYDISETLLETSSGDEPYIDYIQHIVDVVENS